MDKRFYIISDVDSTFEEGQKGDFNGFEESVKRLEEVVGEVRICFATGTNVEDLQKRLTDLNKTNPYLANKFDCAVTCDGFVTAKRMDNVQALEFSNPDQNKSEAISEIISNIGIINASGFVFMGDSRSDLMGMDYLKMLDGRFEYGTYNIMPRSSEVKSQVKYVDYLSDKPRIKGCAEGLNFVIERIMEKEKEM